MEWLAKYGLAGRALVYLRRLADSHERLAVATESLAADSRSRWEREFARPKPRPTTITTMDLAAAERQWARQQAAALEGFDEDDE